MSQGLIKVGVLGAKGRMGSEVVKAVGGASDMQIHAAVDISDSNFSLESMIGADVVAKSPADGYTLLFGTNSTNAALKSLVKNLPYNQDTAFTPIGYFGSVPLIVAINNDVPAKSLNGFVSIAKANPGKMTFAYASTSQRVSSEMLASAADIKMTGVSYKSGPNAMTDLIGGRIELSEQPPDGKLRKASETWQGPR